MARLEFDDMDQTSPVYRRLAPNSDSGVLSSDERSRFVYQHDIPSSDDPDQQKDHIQTLSHDPGDGFQSSMRKKQSTQGDDRDAWIPILVAAFTFNLFLWISLIYAIADIDTDRYDKRRYLTTSLLIFLIPSIAISGVVYGLVLNSNLRARTANLRNKLRNIAHSRHYLPTIYAINAWFCLVLVILYFWVSALPQYKKLRWESGFTNQMSTRIPSFALIDADNLSSANQSLQVNCTLNAGHDIEHCNDALSLSEESSLGYPYWLFNATKLPSSKITLDNPLYSLLLIMNITYPSNGHNTTTFDPSNEAMTFAMFDPRSSLPIGCDNINYSPLFSVGTYTVTYAITEVLDEFGFERSKCEAEYAHLYENKTVPFLSYVPTFGASVISRNATDCWVSDDGSEFICPFNVLIRAGAQIAQTLTSAPGIEKVDIALNASAIVGGIQFFFWFFTTLIPTKITKRHTSIQ